MKSKLRIIRIWNYTQNKFETQAISNRRSNKCGGFARMRLSQITRQPGPSRAGCANSSSQDATHVDVIDARVQEYRAFRDKTMDGIEGLRMKLGRQYDLPVATAPGFFHEPGQQHGPHSPASLGPAHCHAADMPVHFLIKGDVLLLYKDLVANQGCIPAAGGPVSQYHPIALLFS